MKLILFLFLGFVIACNTPSSRASHPLVQHNGVNIVYTDTGRGDTTLLFVHGWCINKSYWSAQVAHFGNAYRVVTIDLPGFGESGRNRNQWDTRTYAQDVDSVIMQLGLKNVILVGHSMAGDIVLLSAIDNPGTVIGFIGIDNFKGVGQPWPEESKAQYAKEIQAMKRDFQSVVIPYFNKELFSSTTAPAIKERILADVKKADTVIAVASMEQGDIDELAKLKASGRTLYLINSDVTPTDTAGLVSNHIPYHIEYTKGTGHYAMVENPDEFNRELERIIQLISKQ